MVAVTRRSFPRPSPGSLPLFIMYVGARSFSLAPGFVAIGSGARVLTGVPELEPGRGMKTDEAPAPQRLAWSGPAAGLARTHARRGRGAPLSPSRCALAAAHHEAR